MKKILNLLIILLVSALSVCGDSLYSHTDPVTGSMFSDKRARKVGDIITVYISESTNSAQKGTTTLKKKSSLDAKIESLLYAMASAPTAATDALYSKLPYLGSRIGAHNGKLPETKWESENDFEGDGELSSSNKVTGTITAMIIEVLPNRNFIVEGKREVTVDGQQRTIVISGIVRSEDIGADNAVLSKNLANARIEFLEKGPISRYRKVGLLKRIWDFIGF